MKFADKEFSFYWEHIQIPFYLFVAWSFAALVIALISVELYYQIFSGVLSFIVQLAIFSYAGYVMIADVKKTHPLYAAWGGALVGAMGGFISAVLGILIIFLVPSIVDAAISQAVAQGAPEALVRQMSTIMTFAGLISGPLFGGLIGGLIGWISGLVTKKTIGK